jgi:hypothetical protein
MQFNRHNRYDGCRAGGNYRRPWSCGGSTNLQLSVIPISRAGADAMTNPEKPADTGNRPIQTLSMHEFNSLVGKNIPATVELPPAMLEYLRQYQVDAVSPTKSPRPVI